MDKDLEKQLAEINLSTDMNRSLQMEILLTSAKMILDESLRGKSEEYRNAWWDGFYFLTELSKEETEIRVKSYDQWKKEQDKVFAEVNKKIVNKKISSDDNDDNPT